MNEEEAIENVKKQLEGIKKANECGLATRGEFNKDIEALETVLNLLEKKDKIINNAIIEIENLRQYFSEDLQPDFIRILEILKDKKVIDW